MAVGLQLTQVSGILAVYVDTAIPEIAHQYHRILCVSMIAVAISTSAFNFAVRGIHILFFQKARGSHGYSPGDIQAATGRKPFHEGAVRIEDAHESFPRTSYGMS